MKLSLVDVIIPTYNRAAVLKRAVCSVLAQTERKWHLWIADDGSTDETPQLVRQWCRQWPLSISYIRWEENKGVSFSRNEAIRRCQSPWIALLDSDDEWHPEKLKKQLENPQALLIHTNEIWIRNGKKLNQKKKHKKKGGDIFDHCLAMCRISPSSALIHRLLFEKIGLFNEEFPVCEDYDFWLRATARHRVQFIDEPLLIKFGGHGDQLSRKYKAMDYWRLKSLWALLKDSELTGHQQEAVQKEIQQKSRILLQGSEKHKNWAYYNEVRRIMESLEAWNLH